MDVGGVYLIYDAEGEVAYVGMSFDIGKRLIDHTGNGHGVYMYIAESREMDPFDSGVKLAIGREMVESYAVNIVRIRRTRRFYRRARLFESTLRKAFPPKYGTR